MMMMKCQFHWWRKPEHPEETVNSVNVNDILIDSLADCGTCQGTVCNQAGQTLHPPKGDNSYPMADNAYTCEDTIA